MQKLLTLPIALALSAFSFADDLPTEEHCVLNDMTKQSFLDFQEGKCECIVLLEEGTVLPLEFLVEGASFAFQGDKDIGSIIVKEPFFMKLKNNEPYFSKDKKDWKSLFHFWGGEISCGISLDDINEHPQAMLKIELNQK